MEFPYDVSARKDVAGVVIETESARYFAKQAVEAFRQSSIGTKHYSEAGLVVSERVDEGADLPINLDVAESQLVIDGLQMLKREVEVRSQTTRQRVEDRVRKESFVVRGRIYYPHYRVHRALTERRNEQLSLYGHAVATFEQARKESIEHQTES